MSKRRKKRPAKRPNKSEHAAPKIVPDLNVLAGPDELLTKPPSAWWAKQFLPGLVLLVVALIYAYWPTLIWITDAWRTEPDYSHGFLVLPLAAMILHRRSESFPGVRNRASYWGLSLIVLALLMRVVGRMGYADFLDGWSLVPLLAGATWMILGFSALKWAFPAILFLILMIPMPYQAESLLSWKLQGMATQLSTVMLRVFGQPAVPEGHIVWIGSERLLIEQACSGLRIFVGVGALAYFWAAVANRSWIDRVVILASALPLAIFANATRITLTGLLYGWFQDDQSRHLIHDLTGFAMIPFAFILLWLVKIYWEHLYRPVSEFTARDSLLAESS